MYADIATLQSTSAGIYIFAQAFSSLLASNDIAVGIVPPTSTSVEVGCRLK
jgi:hypothetical protein